MNTALGWFRAEPRVWLGEPGLALWSALLVSVWRWSGLTMLFFLAGSRRSRPS